MVNAQISGVSDNELIGFLKNRAIWLEPWNMIGGDSIPSIGLLSRIDLALSKIDRFHYHSNACNSRGLLNSDYIELDMEYQRCKFTGAVGFGPDVRSRRQNVDPTNFAAEVLQGEKARLGFMSQFRNLMKITTKKLNEYPTGLNQSPIYCAIFEDYDLHFAEQIPFILKLQHFLPDEVHVFICCDVPSLTPDIRGRFKSRFHQFLTEDFQRIKSEVLKDAYFRGGIS